MPTGINNKTIDSMCIFEILFFAMFLFHQEKNELSTLLYAITSFLCVICLCSFYINANFCLPLE